MWWSRPDPSDVLVVCTGNVCRSPYVAQRLAYELADLRITSAGTGALIGQPPTLQVRSLLMDRSVAAAETPARALTRSSARGARLIITAERHHRVEAIRLAPAAADRAFTLRELARIVRQSPSTDGLGVDGVLEIARRALADTDGVDHDDDLADPYGRSDADYARMAATADDALAAIVPALRRSEP